MFPKSEALASEETPAVNANVPNAASAPMPTFRLLKMPPNFWPVDAIVVLACMANLAQNDWICAEAAVNARPINEDAAVVLAAACVLNVVHRLVLCAAPAIHMRFSIDDPAVVATAMRCENPAKNDCIAAGPVVHTLAAKSLALATVEVALCKNEVHNKLA